MVERDRALLSLALGAFALAHPGSELPDNQRDDEKRAEHDPILGPANVQRKARWNEQEIPRKRAQRREHENRSTPQHGAGDGDGEQVDQRHCPITDERQREQPDQCDGDGDNDGDGICDWPARKPLAPRQLESCGSLFADHEQIDATAILEQPADRRRSQPRAQTGQFRLARDNLRDVVLTRDAEKRFANVRARGADHLAAEPPRECEVSRHARFILGRTGSLDMNGQPGRLHRRRRPPRPPNQFLRVRAGTHRDHDARTHLPRLGHVLTAATRAGRGPRARRSHAATSRGVR